MLSFLTNLSSYKYLGYGAVLALGLGGCEQQPAEPVSTAPIPQMQAARYYLNAKPSTKEVIEQLDPQTMTRMDVLDGEQAATYAHNTSIKRLLLAQTK